MAPSFKRLSHVLACGWPADRGILPRLRTNALHLRSLVLLAALATVAVAGPRAAWAEPPKAAPSSIDGLHLAIGPIGSGIHRSDGWDSRLGAELFFGRVSERRVASVVAASLGLSSFADGSARRVTANLYLGTRRLFGLHTGLSVGPIVDFFETHRPRYGAKASVWLFAGVMPYLSVGRVTGLGAPAGPEIEIGIKIPISAASW